LGKDFLHGALGKAGLLRKKRSTFANVLPVMHKPSCSKSVEVCVAEKLDQQVKMTLNACTA
jgi:hypothetical protein